jgi:hypothetical protein
MQTETTTTTYTYNLEQQLRLLAIIKAGLQSLVTLYNLIGDQAAAHRCSRELCAVLAQEFQINPHSRRSR